VTVIKGTEPFIVWPKPFGSWSSIHGAAEACWRLAERHRRLFGGVDPAYTLPGAMAYALDILEDARKVHGLPLSASLQDVMAAMGSMQGIEGGDKRRRYVLGLLDYAAGQAARP
jgi:hypothetical protein